MQLPSTVRRPAAAATPIMQAARSRAPVFLSLMAVSSSAVWMTFLSPTVSRYCPPHMPPSPAASARSAAAAAGAYCPSCRQGPGAESTVWKAAACRASPARVAMHSP